MSRSSRYPRSIIRDCCDSTRLASVTKVPLDPWSATRRSWKDVFFGLLAHITRFRMAVLLGVIGVGCICYGGFQIGKSADFYTRYGVKFVDHVYSLSDNPVHMNGQDARSALLWRRGSIWISVGFSCVAGTILLGSFSLIPAKLMKRTKLGKSLYVPPDKSDKTERYIVE